MKKWMQRVKENMMDRLEKLAAENRQKYGGQRLDCCGMNNNRLQQVSGNKDNTPT